MRMRQRGEKKGKDKVSGILIGMVKDGNFVKEECHSPAVRLPQLERASKVVQGEEGAGGTERCKVTSVKVNEPV